MPDPISKATWGNYVCIAPKTAAKMGVGSSDVVAVKAGAVTVELPVVLSPGMHEGAVAIAVGYGRKAAGRIGNDIGVHVGGFAALGSAVLVDVSVTGKKDPVAFSQTHHSYEHRDAVRETSLEHWLKEADAGNEALPNSLQDKVMGKRYTRSLWDRHQYLGHKWGMAIDMNACTGCSACIIACVAENNIPVVGKDQVKRNREMHWLRIDRYFAGNLDTPDTYYQPMPCQQCENAPCEVVCPVSATVHSDEGLNDMVYNRCVGTSTARTIVRGRCVVSTSCCTKTGRPRSSSCSAIRTSPSAAAASWRSALTACSASMPRAFSRSARIARFATAKS